MSIVQTYLQGTGSKAASWSDKQETDTETVASWASTVVMDNLSPFSTDQTKSLADELFGAVGNTPAKVRMARAFLQAAFADIVRQDISSLETLNPFLEQYFVDLSPDAKEKASELARIYLRHPNDRDTIVQLVIDSAARFVAELQQQQPPPPPQQPAAAQAQQLQQQQQPPVIVQGRDPNHPDEDSTSSLGMNSWATGYHPVASGDGESTVSGMPKDINADHARDVANEIDVPSPPRGDSVAVVDNENSAGDGGSAENRSRTQS